MFNPVVLGILLATSALIAIGGIFPASGQSENTTSVISNRTDFFNFEYMTTGGIAGQTEKITYISDTGQLTISDRDNKTTNKTLSADEEKMVKDAIENSGFFEAEMLYPPPDGADIIWHSLRAIIGDRISAALPRENAVTWTEQSEGVPPGLQDAVARHRESSVIDIPAD